jgi:hypothetical protein
MQAIQRSGYAHVSREVDRASLEEFVKEHNLRIEQDNACFTYTLRKSDHRERATIESLRAQLGRKRK